MSVEKFCLELQENLSAVSTPVARLETAARAVGAYFGVRDHEVAFFTIDEPRHAIVFRWPKSLATVGNIPLRAVNSVVSRTANERIPIIDNSFAKTRHLYIMEHFLANPEDRIPVQKIMSVPVVTGETVIGVIQVARKGAKPEDAGTDFTERDLADLELIAAAIAKDIAWG